jgi:hypothetical protein
VQLRQKTGRQRVAKGADLDADTFVTAQGSPLTRLRRALAGGDLLAARTAAAELPHIELDEAVDLILLIAHAARAGFATTLRRLRLERAAHRIETTRPRDDPLAKCPDSTSSSWTARFAVTNRAEGRICQHDASL